MKENIIDNIIYMKKLRQRIDGKDTFDDYYEVVSDFMNRNMKMSQKLNTPFLPEESVYLVGICTLIKRYFINHEKELKELWDKQMMKLGAICLN